MAHKLTTRKDGTVEMAYTGDKPWHGLGNPVPNAMTSKEAIEAASMDWNVITTPVYINLNGEHLQVPDKAAIIREDTQEVFNILSDRYTPVQNVEAFQFFDAVVAAGSAIYHTVGSLDGGRRVWIAAKLPTTLKVTNQDLIEKYILLSNSHDGTKALTMQLTPIRVVCNNTLSVALKEKTTRFYGRHTPNILSRAKNAQELLGLSEAYFQLFMDGVTALAAKKMKESDMQAMLVQLFKLEEHKVDERKMRAETEYSVAKVRELFESGKGNDLKGVKGTAWAAYNAVTEFVDSYRLVGKGMGSKDSTTLATADRRVDASWFGKGADLRQSAWDYLLN